jgi:hypothetical protein
MSRRKSFEEHACEGVARMKAEEATEEKRSPDLPGEDGRLDRA